MFPLFTKLRPAAVALSLLLSLSACGNGAAPKSGAVSVSLKKIMPIDFEIVSIVGVPEIPGLFEVVVKVDKQVVVFYTDKKAKLVISGSIVQADTKQNLTMLTQKKFAQ